VLLVIKHTIAPINITRPLMLGIPHTKPRTEVSSLNSFGAIDAAMVDMTLNDL